MKCLVTGGAGFIGSNLVDQLVKEGHEVQIWDDLSTGDKYNVNPKARLHICDIGGNFKAREVLMREFDPDVIFHLAALARIQPSFDDPITTHDINTGGTFNICELAKRVGAKVVYAGSSSFYAGPHLNPYSFTKWQGEEICKLYSEVYDVSTSIARFFNVFGPRQETEGAYATVVGIFERQYKNNEPLTITRDGEQRRDFTHVKDICRGLIQMSRKDWKGEIFNIGHPEEVTIVDLANLIININQSGSNITFTPHEEVYGKSFDDPKRRTPDISKIINEINYKPSMPLEEMIKEISIHMGSSS